MTNIQDLNRGIARAEEQLAEAELWVPILEDAEALLEVSDAKFHAPQYLRDIREGRRGGIMRTRMVGLSGGARKEPIPSSLPELREVENLLADWPGTGLNELRETLRKAPATARALRAKLPAPDAIGKAKARARALEQTVTEADAALDEALRETLAALEVASVEASGVGELIDKQQRAESEAEQLRARYGVDVDIRATVSRCDAEALIETARAAVESSLVRKRRRSLEVAA